MEEEIQRIEARADALVEAHENLMRALVEMRKTHKISQETVAERMSVSQPTVAAFERYDSNPTLSTIRRYALAVGARLQNSVIDDCEEHATAFEALTESTHLSTSIEKPRSVGGPMCQSCYAETEQCSVCYGTGEVRNLGLWEPSDCSECNGTGYLCVANNHGKYWNS